MSHGGRSCQGEKTDSTSSRHKARIVLCIRYVTIFAVASVMTLPFIIVNLPSPSKNAIGKVGHVVLASLGFCPQVVVKFYDVASCSIASTVLRTSDITVCLLRTGAVPRCFGSCAFTNNN